MTVLVTGGAGYIGSHTVLALLEQGEQVVVLDNLSNSVVESLRRVEQLTGRSVTFYHGDIRNAACLDEIFTQYHISTVIHFAGLKAVGESVSNPLEYYQNNVAGTLTLLQQMQQAKVYRLIFSSSATVYGTNATVPYTESAPVGATTNPYGTSKLMVEQVLQDLARAEPHFSIIALRYFNPVGAHESGLIGEDPNGIPNNLLPYISQVAVGKLARLGIFGDDYPTKDGTGVRDYIHVMDLAEGHLAAMRSLPRVNGFKAYNLGTGVGYSVFEMLRAFEKASGITIPYQVLPRRAGDLAACWADTTLAKQELGWKAVRGIDVMMRDTWNWQRQNPQGYQS
ncbi:UDP-glucose 4-epimerase GalE [Serratia microhaemolytica]|uniref:UDP-glucose 4-epimerase GalE n=1 Tax=Serratia microhaemolytica TaxID=2675110 RepID=UPI000FDF0118|nr:UDP-glucose 4-epimerase GalE [Serratia microhaemolytica]